MLLYVAVVCAHCSKTFHHIKRTLGLFTVFLYIKNVLLRIFLDVYFSKRKYTGSSLTGGITES